MATGDDLLTQLDDLIEDLDANDGTDETRALRALNRAQDSIEMVLSVHPGMFATVDESVTTTADQEYSQAPADLLRLDSLWLLDSDTSRPLWELVPIHTPGFHRDDRPVPLLDLSRDTSGKPRGYWFGEGTSVGRGRYWWDRDPDAAYTIRTVGFFAASDITENGTFAYPDQFIQPTALVAARTFRFRLEDPIDELRVFTQEVLGPVIEQQRKRFRHGPRMPRYTGF